MALSVSEIPQHLRTRAEGMDEDDEDYLDDNIIPGCYVLDIGIEELQYSSIWIRADYIRIHDYFHAHYTKYAKPVCRAPGAVLTGQPGIGEFPSVTEPF